MSHHQASKADNGFGNSSFETKWLLPALQNWEQNQKTTPISSPCPWQEGLMLQNRVNAEISRRAAGSTGFRGAEAGKRAGEHTGFCLICRCTVSEHTGFSTRSMFLAL